MKFKYKDKISFKYIMINFIVIMSFSYAIFNSYKFEDLSKTTAVQAYINNLRVLSEEISDGSAIDPKNIYIGSLGYNGLIYYIVQPGNSLGFIANDFGVTVAHIKKVNNLKNDIIKPGQKLIITSQNGFLYISKGETSKNLAEKFKVKEKDILDVNSISNINYKFNKGTEVFIPMSDEQLKKHRAKNKKTNYAVQQAVVKRNSSYNGKNIVSRRWYRPNVSNGFYRGHCTRYVAIKKFPYITKNKQKKPWNGNARHWYKNAKAAGYKVGKIPKIGSIVVIKIGNARYFHAGHVGIVKQIDLKKNKILIEEMNAVGKYIVTKRWINMDNKIIGYIYYNL